MMLPSNISSRLAPRAVQRMALTMSTRSIGSYAINRMKINARNDHEEEWSHTLSYAEPESDFTASDRYVPNNQRQRDDPEWSETLSFAEAESDFSASDRFVFESKNASDEWSDSLSFASPESDFVSAPQTALGEIHVAEVLPQSPGNTASDVWSNTMSFSTPESDFVSAPMTALGMVHAGEVTDKKSTSTNNAAITLDPFHSLLLLSSQTATGNVAFTEMLDDRTKADLLEQRAAMERLPKSLSDALKDSRPIVITKGKAPFRVHDVNDAWESLCGYSREEAVNRNLGELLQGSKTNIETAQDMVRQLERTGFSQATLTNYKKSGAPFENRVQVGTIYSENENTTFFVGVLQDINENVVAQKKAAV